MPITVTVTPGKQFATDELIETPGLNMLGRPTIAITGTVGNSDLGDAVVSDAKILQGAFFYTSSVTFSAGIYTAVFNPVPTLVDGLVIVFKANVDNTGATQLNATGVAKVLFKDGVPLGRGDIIANQIVEVRYDVSGNSGAGAWQLMSRATVQNSYYGVDIGAVNTYSVVFTPPAGANAIGLTDIVGIPLRVKIKAGSTSTASSTLQVQFGTATALTATAITKYGGGTVAAGDIQENSVVEFIYNGSTFQMNTLPGNAPVDNDTAVVSQVRNFKVSNNAAANKIDFTADEVVLKNTSGIPFMVRNLSVSLDASASGANGLDTGTIASTTLYKLWIIYNPTTATAASLLSTSSTTPVLPAGYSFQALVGAWPVGTAPNFYQNKFIQDRYAAVNEIVVSAATRPDTTIVGLVSDGSGTLSGTGFAAVVPHFAKRLHGVVAVGSDNSLYGIIVPLTAVGGTPPDPTDGSTYFNMRSSGVPNAGTAYYAITPFSVANRGTPTTYGFAISVRASTAFYVFITGYDF